MIDVNLVVYYTPVVILLRANQRRETTAGKQLVQACYAVVSVGVELPTFKSQGGSLSTEPRRLVIPFHVIPLIDGGGEQ